MKTWTQLNPSERALAIPTIRAAVVSMLLDNSLLPAAVTDEFPSQVTLLAEVAADAKTKAAAMKPSQSSGVPDMTGQLAAEFLITGARTELGQVVEFLSKNAFYPTYYDFIIEGIANE